MNGMTALPQRHNTHLLVVEDEPVIREIFSTLLSAAGFSVSQAQDGFHALEEVRRQRPALILSDLNMPRMTGFELLSVVRRRFPDIHVIAMSGAFDGEDVPDGVSADAFYQKSGRHISTLVEVIENIIRTVPGNDPDSSSASLERPAGSTGVADSAGSHDSRQPETEPHVALWVSRRGTPIDGPYILLSCPECLRSFPHCTEDEKNMEIRQTACVYCHASITYALLDPNITHHPGYAPAAR